MRALAALGTWTVALILSNVAQADLPFRKENRGPLVVRSAEQRPKSIGPSLKGLLFTANRSAKRIIIPSTKITLPELKILGGGFHPEITVLPIKLPTEPLSAAEWTASFFAEEIGCTVTLIGPNVLLTAAHCVGDRQFATISERTNDSEEERIVFQGECRRAPDYGRNYNYTADFALCFSSRAASEFSSQIVFERIDINSGWLRRSARLFLTGYGCTALGGAGVGMGDHGAAATVIYAGQNINKGLFAYAGKTWNNNQIATITTKQTDGSLCAGDSGGPTLFLYDGELASSRRRAIVAVNSANRASTGSAEGISYLSSLSGTSFLKFLSAWLSQHQDARICGLGRKQDVEIDFLCHN